MTESDEHLLPELWAYLYPIVEVGPGHKDYDHSREVSFDATHTFLRLPIETVRKFKDLDVAYRDTLLEEEGN